MPSLPSLKVLHWDLFCRVLDNFGDVGVCWRLACELAVRGQQVRLIIDDPAPLSWMAPAGHRGVQVLPWPGPAEPGDVVIEAFGCDPPAAFVRAMAAMKPAPVWINFEYLSAESYVERSHGLLSPQRNGLEKWFFYPGFTGRTGGLLREHGLAQSRQHFDRRAWLAAQGLAPAAGERVVGLFCYDNLHVPQLLHELAREPTLLLLTPGHAQRQVQDTPAGVRALRMPWLSQPDFDRLLWSCDLNFVRGEDSLVRAIWAGVPFVWQAYAQHDGAHLRKVQAMLQQWSAPPEAAALWLAWNDAGAGPWPGVVLSDAWRAAAAAWCQHLQAQTDLASQLHAFALGKAGRGAC
jgi:uncharacterized repeat protein (TIGR03837 family)